MKKIISALIIFSIFLLSSFASAFPWSDFFFSPACTDSDNGQNINVKGTATDNSGSFVDSCYSTNQVYERYCTSPSGTKTTVIMTCPSGQTCSDGKCSASTTPSAQTIRQMRFYARDANGIAQTGASVQVKQGNTNVGAPLTTTNGFTPEITLNIGQTYNFLVSKSGYNAQTTTLAGASSVTISSGTTTLQYDFVLAPTIATTTPNTTISPANNTPAQTANCIDYDEDSIYGDNFILYDEKFAPSYASNGETTLNDACISSYSIQEAYCLNNAPAYQISVCDDNKICLTNSEGYSYCGFLSEERETQDDKGPEDLTERATCTDDDPDNSLTILGTCIPTSGPSKVDKCTSYPKNKIIQYSCKQNGQCFASSSSFCSIEESCLEGVCIKKRDVVVGVRFSNDNLLNRILRAFGLR